MCTYIRTCIFRICGCHISIHMFVFFTYVFTPMCCMCCVCSVMDSELSMAGVVCIDFPLIKAALSHTLVLTFLLIPQTVYVCTRYVLCIASWTVCALCRSCVGRFVCSCCKCLALSSHWTQLPSVSASALCCPMSWARTYRKTRMASAYEPCEVHTFFSLCCLQTLFVVPCGSFICNITALYIMTAMAKMYCTRLANSLYVRICGGLELPIHRYITYILLYCTFCM